jgi:hypothetical protein
MSTGKSLEQLLVIDDDDYFCVELYDYLVQKRMLDSL